VTVYPTHLRLPSVYVDDLAEAMCRMLERPVAAGKAYNIAGEPGTTYWQLLEAYAAAGGHRAPWIIPVPVPLERRFDITRAQRDLDFTNRPLHEGFADLIRREREMCR
jgi:nucleoside-diphosphate-sugar epimerase